MSWVAHDIRDELVDFVRHWSEQTEICYEQLLGWIELSARKFRDWRVRYGKVNEHILTFVKDQKSRFKRPWGDIYLRRRHSKRAKRTTELSFRSSLVRDRFYCDILVTNPYDCDYRHKTMF